MCRSCSARIFSLAVAAAEYGRLGCLLHRARRRTHNLSSHLTGLEPALDLLDGLQLRNVSRQGVSAVPGPQHFRTAFYLQGDYRDLRLPPSSFQRAIDLLRHNTEFTLAASLRQEEANSGTIIAFSHGFNRYLELQSSGRKDEIRLHYTAQYDASIHVEVFPYRLADNMWHKVALSISGAQVELLVDCQILYRRLIRMPDRNFTAPQLSLWVGQRNSKHSFFKGAVEEVRIIAGPHGYLKQCPLLDSSCPTCGQFSLLQSTVEQLTQNLYDLSQRLIAAEERISKVESCDCYKSCRVNGSIHADGASWQHDCEICSCVHGDIQCRPVQCPEVNCKNPVREPGKCCPVCRKQCLLRGVMYDDGESVNLRTCVDCQCRNGFMHCVRRDPNITCPPLPCSPQEQFSVPEECCKFCPGVDYCNKGHMCHENATCLNLQTTYACHCNTGFSGDGHLCHDVDECQQEGGLDGHHCHSNTRCVNTPGSYVCECLPGYRRLDKFNCVELDECSTGEHGCHSHASCVNTLGSYRCQCQQGYEGDGYNCKPVCNQTCLNGGECIAPEKCQCRQGYVGDYCEQDLDECTTDMHNCHQSSQCVNMPGWYYCRCKSGFRALPHHDSVLGAICQDVDECAEGLHTCHPSAKCVNTEGSFQCSCSETETLDCKLSCMFEGDELMNGGVVTPKGRPCHRCECSDGVVSCHDPICDCSQRNSRNDKCCPQCDPSAACHHQELRHVVFRSGERWIYQCQTCECLYGEIDCWPMECPPLLCSEPILAPGDCCPRCEDDPCPLDKGDNGSSGQPCTYAGHLFESGTQWQNPHDKCSTCNCKVPYCAQLVSNTACCVHRMGGFAAVMTTVVVAVTLTTLHSLLEVLHILFSLIVLLVKFLMKIPKVGWQACCHRKHKFGRLLSMPQATTQWTKSYHSLARKCQRTRQNTLLLVLFLTVVVLGHLAVEAAQCLRLQLFLKILEVVILTQFLIKLVLVWDRVLKVLQKRLWRVPAHHRLQWILTMGIMWPELKNVIR